MAEAPPHVTPIASRDKCRRSLLDVRSRRLPLHGRDEADGPAEAGYSSSEPPFAGGFWSPSCRDPFRSSAVPSRHLLLTILLLKITFVNSYFRSLSTTVFTTSPSALPLSSFMRVPINIPALDLSIPPTSSIFDLAKAITSSSDII